jgi:DNA mismatch repair protein MutH
MEFDSIAELMKYSENIIGKSLNDIINENEGDFSDKHTMKKTKGILGELVETEFYKYPNNNVSKADFEKLGIELKTTGIIKNSKGIRAKERLVLNMINYMEIINEEFETSHLMEKNNLILILWYCYQTNKDFKDFKFISILLYSLYRDQDIIENDFNIIKNKVLEGKAHELSEGDTTYLGACTKSSTSKVTRKQPFSDIPAKPRAFCLKNKYMNLISNDLLNNKEIHTTPKKHEFLSVIDFIKSKMEPFFGMTQIEIADEIGITYDINKRIPKNINKLISDKIIGKDNELQEIDEIFQYSSYVIKNSPITKNGFKERMSFKNIKLSDFDVDWDNSSWKNYFEEINIINILYEGKNPSIKNGFRILKDVKSLTFTPDEIDCIGRTFNMIKNAIKEYENKTYGNDLDKYVELLPTPKSFEGQIMDVLPKSSKGKDSYYTLFVNDNDSTKVALALTKDFLNKKLNFI